MIGIYKFTNKITGESYIGQSINIVSRYNSHKYLCGSDTYFHKNIRYYGFNNFSFEVLEECSKEELNDKEIYYIKKYNTVYPKGYNISRGGNTGVHRLYKLNTYADVSNIIELLKNSKMTNTDIAKLYNVTPQYISQINNGDCCVQEDLTYPIRDSKIIANEKARKEKPRCQKCGQTVTSGSSGLCRKCYNEMKSSHLPSKEELFGLLLQLPFSKVGEMFNVSDNAVRKWCDKYNIPRHSSYYRNAA